MAKKKRKKKRKEPAHFKHQRACAKAIGIQPFKAWTASQKKKVKACVQKKMGKKK